MFSERSGVVNIALEGLMLFGAFIGIVTTLLMGDTWGSMTPWIALLFAAIGSGLFALLHAVASITFRAHQVVSGVAINFLALGLTVFAIKKIFGKGQTDFIQYRIEKLMFGSFGYSSNRKNLFLKCTVNIVYCYYFSVCRLVCHL